jgi:hypothetical protein
MRAAAQEVLVQNVCEKGGRTVKRIGIRFACASILTALALSGCAGGDGNVGGDDRIGAFGTGYGSNGTRLLERDARDRIPGSEAERADRSGKAPAAGVDRRDERFGAGVSGGRPKTGAGDGGAGSVGVGNGYDGITPDGAGTSDPEGAAERGRNEGGGTALRIGGIEIRYGYAASAGEAAAGGRVLRVASPAAREALERLIRSLESGPPSARADEIARDLRIVLKDAR